MPKSIETRTIYERKQSYWRAGLIACQEKDFKAYQRICFALRALYKAEPSDEGYPQVSDDYESLPVID